MTISYGYVGHEYSDSDIGAFRLFCPPLFEKVSIAPHQGNHCFAVIGKRDEIMKWLSDEHPNKRVELTETFAWRKNSFTSGLIRVRVRHIKLGYDLAYLFLGKLGSSTLMLEFTPWDGEIMEGEEMPIDKENIDAIPLKGESVLVRSGTLLADVANKLKNKKKLMEKSGEVKVMGLTLERASTYSSIQNDRKKRNSILGLKRNLTTKTAF